MKIKVLICLACVGLFITCTFDTIHYTDVMDEKLRQQIKQVSPDGSMDHYVLPDHDQLDKIPQDPRNPLTPAKVSLGQFLFFETGLAQNPMHEQARGTYSCASCHIPSSGFKPGRVQGIADGGVGFGDHGEGRKKMDIYDESELDVQGIRPLSLYNVAFVENTLWNGQFGAGGVNEGTEEQWNEEDLTDINHRGFKGIESQNIQVMDLHRLVMNEEIADTLGYKSLFDIAFSEYTANERYSKFTASLAISAYIRSLITDQAPFQEWLQGNNYAMTTQEKQGALLFFGKAGCYRCHKDKNLGANEFHAIGAHDLHRQPGTFFTGPDDKKNLGRGGFTGKEEDYYKFKVPQLYNLNDAPFFFHGSSKETLEEVVEYFNRAEPENPNVPEDKISPFLTPLNLTEKEKEDLLAFLKHGLYDPNYERYVPGYVKSGNCFPNNDPQSREDMGCQ